MGAGPAGARLLADLGAEVIHVEQREHGDLLRGLAAFYGQPLFLSGGRQIHFEDHNRNKKSLAIDPAKSSGREVIRRLVEKSDVFMTNLRLGTVDKLGFDYGTISSYNAGIIYAGFSGAGQKGPDWNVPSVDLLGIARAGTMMGSGEPGAPPVNVIPGLSDYAGAICMAYGVLIGLLARERLGIGQEIHVSHLAVTLSCQLNSVAPALFGVEIPRLDRTKASNPLYSYYRCQDDKWIAVVVGWDWYWPVFCHAVGRPEWATDPRFESIEAREKNREELVGLLDELFATKARGDWIEIFLEAGDISFAPVNTVMEALADPNVEANDYLIRFQHPELGEVRFAPYPVTLTKTPPIVDSPAPQLGQNNEEILTEVCGYSWEEVGRLRDEEVI
jgi:crotonobetainyl-CoA:carnitine CoA-transferase CaiB-like acyl-CoA transferase